MHFHPSDAADWDAARLAFFRDGNAAPLLESRTRLVDRQVQAAFSDYLAPGFSSGLAVAAVGGFGRRELFPHSDVDVLILVEAESLAGVSKEAVAEFLRTLWDRQLRVSQSVHTVAECCELHEGNIELSISLLDHRFLAGDRDLYERLSTRLPKFLHARAGDLARHLGRLARARHARFQETIYHLEPNLKEAPGGLRDLHLAGWLSKLGYNGAQAPPEAREFLHTLRAFLHFQTGRDNNLLTYDAQDDLAAAAFAGRRGPAELMRLYYRHARAICRAAAAALEGAEGPGGSLLAQFRDWRGRVSNTDFSVVRERVLLRSPHALKSDPELAGRLFRFVARHGFRLAADTAVRLAEHLPALASRFAAGGDFWPVLREIFELPHAALALREMHDSGVLGAMFPEWSRIDCLVVRDFYHRYTVDEHSLVAVQALTDLRNATDPARRRFTEMLEEAGETPALLFALLFHDAGKGAGGGHVQESLRLADAAMRRIAMPLAVRLAVRFLIERHLELSAVMTTRDLEEPSTARALADRAETIERLKLLTLITYADISAVNPTAMSPWRLEQLWRAYVAAHRELTRELDTDRIPAAGLAPEMAAFLEGFPTRYLRTHSEEEIAAHFELDRHCGPAGVAVEIRRSNGVYHATVAAGDRQGLFASLAGALSSFGMNILKAEAFGNRRGRVLDTFVFADPARTLELNAPEVDRLRLTLERAATGKADVRALLRGRPKPAPLSREARVHPSVTFDNQASGSSTLIEIVARDRPGLLYDLAGALSTEGCDIQVVLIDTEAHKALDVFYVTRGGEKLPAAALGPLRERLLRAC